MKTSPITALLAVASSLVAGTAVAAPVAFFGQDLTQTTTEIAHPNADAAQAAFRSTLVGVGTETFDGLSLPGNAPLALTFPGAGTATLTGNGGLGSGDDGAGRYAISGAQYYNASSDSFYIDFTSPIAAFGFYGVDIGDYGGLLSLRLTDTNGNVTTLDVPMTVGTNGETNGNALYFGFYDLTTQYSRIDFVNPSGGGDVFAFDDMTVGVLEQVVPNPVPEPGALALAGLALAGLALQRRARKA